MIDEELSTFVQKKAHNELSGIIKLIEPYRDNLQTVMGNAFNWYWLVDRLQEAGFDVLLAHPYGL